MKNCNIPFAHPQITLTAIRPAKGNPKELPIDAQVFELDDNPCFVLDETNRKLTRNWEALTPGVTITYEGKDYLCSKVLLSKRPKHPILITRPLKFGQHSSFYSPRATISVTPPDARCEVLDSQDLQAQIFEIEGSLYCFLDKSKASLESKGFVIDKGYLIDLGRYRFQCTDVLDLISPFRQVLKAKLVCENLIA